VHTSAASTYLKESHCLPPGEPAYHPTAADHLQRPDSKVAISLEKLGNTTAATIPMALGDAARDGQLKHPDTVVLASVGAMLLKGSL
jgi:3-oxoacyl-[acyl-carrier-protein] synthase III